MLSLLLSFGVGQRREASARVATKHSANQKGSDDGVARFDIISGANNHVDHSRLVLVVFCLAVSSLLIQSAQSNQTGKPCICNTTFYKMCPPDSQCMENFKPDKIPIALQNLTSPRPRSTRPPAQDDYDGRFDDDYDDDNDDYDHMDDPDHPVNLDHLIDDKPFPFFPKIGGYGAVQERQNEPRTFEMPRPAYERKRVIPSNQEPVTRHRKIYVAPRQPMGDVPIHPIKITIPVSVPVYKEQSLPKPDPVFKYKKYTSYETKPEIQMVPVKKTIIKPVGVRPDQIINEAILGPQTLVQ